MIDNGKQIIWSRKFQHGKIKTKSYMCQEWIVYENDTNVKLNMHTKISSSKLTYVIIMNLFIQALIPQHTLQF
jgi:hypothetical protein